MSNPYKKLTGDSRDHLTQILEMINNGEHFGLIRPNDGEHSIMENMSFTNIDHWTNTADSILRSQLIEAVQTKRPNLYIGITSPQCFEGKIYEDYIHKYCVPKEQLTYANIFVNANWARTMNFFSNYQKGFYLVTCGTRECDYFPIKGRYIIDRYLVNRWNDVHEVETERILNFIKDKHDEIICFSAGPIAKVWIPKCMEVNPNNIYLDTGSAFDSFLKDGYTYRDYVNPDHEYSKFVCNFDLHPVSG